MEPNDLIALFGLVTAILTSVLGAVFWYVNSEKRKYGLERDFAHLKKHYEQINQNLDLIFKEMDHRFDDLEKNLIKINSILNIKK